MRQFVHLLQPHHQQQQQQQQLQMSHQNKEFYFKLHSLTHTKGPTKSEKG